MLAVLRESSKLCSSLVSSVITETTRTITTSTVLHGKRNFRRFPCLNKRGTRLFKKMRQEALKNNEAPEIPHHNRGVRATGVYIPVKPLKGPRPIVPLEKGIGTKFVEVPEMIPEMIVPDLKDFPLKPYVSYRMENIHQPEFTPEQLFEAVYAEKITSDYKKGKLDENGQPLEPSPEEKLTPKEAYNKARQTGSDLFTQDPPPIFVNGVQVNK